MSDDRGPEILVVFRSRRRPEAEEAYQAEAARIGDIARTMPGYVSHKGFRSPDGENVTIVEFESMAHMEAWRANRDHVAAKRRGRAEFYESYTISIAEVVDKHAFP
jgi:heme-degrading monooxygenase HmoA